MIKTALQGRLWKILYILHILTLHLVVFWGMGWWLILNYRFNMKNSHRHIITTECFRAKVICRWRSDSHHSNRWTQRLIDVTPDGYFEIFMEKTLFLKTVHRWWIDKLIKNCKIEVILIYLFYIYHLFSCHMQKYYFVNLNSFSIKSITNTCNMLKRGPKWIF